MDVEQYISSGILELYVAGALEKEAMIEVAQNIQQYKEVKAEVMLIEKALLILFKATAPKIIDAAQDQLKNGLVASIKNKI